MGILIKIGCGGVCLDKLHPAMRLVLREVDLIWKEDPVITSTWDGVHSSGSFHYFCMALDFRLPKEKPLQKVEELKEKLGSDYDVVLENDHVHVEYDPKIR